MQEKLDPIVESVRRKLLERSQTGIKKYGTMLNRTDLSRLDWLRHAQEEALDLANYLEVLIQQEESTEKVEKQEGADLDEIHRRQKVEDMYRRGKSIEYRLRVVEGYGPPVEWKSANVAIMSASDQFDWDRYDYRQKVF